MAYNFREWKGLMFCLKRLISDYNNNKIIILVYLFDEFVFDDIISEGMCGHVKYEEVLFLCG